MVPIELSDEVKAARVLLDGLELSLLDGIWTQRLGQRSVVNDQEFQTLKRLTDDMKSLMMEIKERSSRISYLIEANSDQAYIGFTNLLENTPVSETDRQLLKEKLDSPEKFSHYIARSAKEVSLLIEKEQQEISAKLDEIYKGKTSKGDISQNAACAIGGVMVGGGAVLVLTGVGAVVGGALVGFGIGFAAGNDCF